MNQNQINNDVLNDLVQINNDRIEGYRKASDELSVQDQDLRTFFAEISRQSANFKSELIEEIQVSGEEPDSGTTTMGKIYRAWMDVKAVFTGHDRKTILGNCESGEDAAKEAYNTALNTEDLSPNIREIISGQLTELLIVHNHIKALRDSSL